MEWQNNGEVTSWWNKRQIGRNNGGILVTEDVAPVWEQPVFLEVGKEQLVATTGYNYREARTREQRKKGDKIA